MHNCNSSQGHSALWEAIVGRKQPCSSGHSGLSPKDTQLLRGASGSSVASREMECILFLLDPEVFPSALSSP